MMEWVINHPIWAAVIATAVIFVWRVAVGLIQWGNDALEDDESQATDEPKQKTSKEVEKIMADALRNAKLRVLDGHDEE